MASIKWNLWHGKSAEGLEKIGEIDDYFIKHEEDNMVEKRYEKRKAFEDYVSEFYTYISNNHLGDGNFFIIVAGKYMEQLNKQVGSLIHFKIEEDPDQLGVEMPEVLEALLNQDEYIKSNFYKINIF